MAQKINVDATPGLFQQTLYYHQGDVGREFEIEIATKDGYTIPSGATFKIEATKPSGFGFTVEGTASDNVVSFTSTEEMTDEWGRFLAQLEISSGNTVIYTANFLMVGEKDTHPASTIDGSQEDVIPQLTLLVERVENAAAAVLDTTTEVTTLPAGSQATYSFDEETNTATFGIPQGEAGAGAAGVVANAYSASKTYAVGDYVIHNSNLYRCTTAIATAESFTAAHWTQVVLSDAVTDLKSDLTVITNNVAIPITEKNGYVDLSGSSVTMADGVPARSGSSGSYNYCVIACQAGEKFTINGEGGVQTRLWGFVASDGSILEKAESYATATNLIYEAPTNSAFLIIHGKQESWVNSYKGVLTKLQIDETKLQIDELRSDLSDLENDLKSFGNVIDFTTQFPISGSYVELDGRIVSYPKCFRTDYMPISEEHIFMTVSSNKTSRFNCFYDGEKTFISNFKVNAGKNYIQIPTNAKYYILSTDQTSENPVTQAIADIRSKTILRGRPYDLYVASSDSVHASEADLVCDGTDDSFAIRRLIDLNKFKSIYFYDDSTFICKGAIYVSHPISLISNGATFTTINQVVANVTEITNSYKIKLSSTSDIVGRAHLYAEDASGHNQCLRVSDVSGSSITLLDELKSEFSPLNSMVVKTASPCFYISQTNNVVIKGLVIDWNVANNPIQTYNPSFIQEGITINYSEDIEVDGCIIKNGGRRGIFLYDSKCVRITDCTCENWHEHGIDIFNTYTEHGNTTNRPIMNRCVVKGVISRSNKMSGIQLHRGSGIVVSDCICFNNDISGISMLERPHDNIVCNNILQNNGSGIVLTTTWESLIIGNICKNNNNNGIKINNCFAIVIADNKLSYNTLTGIFLASLERGNIHNNYLYGNQGNSSLKIAGVSFKNMINNNTVFNDNQSGVVYGIAEYDDEGGVPTNNIVIGNIIDGFNTPTHKAPSGSSIFENNYSY